MSHSDRAEADRLSMIQPELYGAEAGGEVRLHGMRCICGHVAFPFHRLGCERCGRTQGQEQVALKAKGTLAAAVCVHLHMGSHHKAPFYLGAIRLDDGPMVRALLGGDGHPPGATVVGELVESVSAVGTPGLDLRFTSRGAKGGAHA